MPKFRYKVRDWQGTPLKGVIEADTETAAGLELRSKQYGIEQLVQIPPDRERLGARVWEGIHAYETTKAIGCLVVLLSLPFLWCAGETLGCLRNSSYYSRIAKDGIETEAVVGESAEGLKYAFTDVEHLKRSGRIGTFRTSVDESQFRSGDFDRVPRDGDRIPVRYLPGQSRIHAPAGSWNRMVARNRAWLAGWALGAAVTCVPLVLTSRHIVRRIRARWYRKGEGKRQNAG